MVSDTRNPEQSARNIERSRALVAAWLPGTEGGGVADVLFGATAPTGKLSFTSPARTDQIPINAGDGKTDALTSVTPVGGGRRYAATKRSARPAAVYRPT